MLNQTELKELEKAIVKHNEYAKSYEQATVEVVSTELAKKDIVRLKFHLDDKVIDEVSLKIVLSRFKDETRPNILQFSVKSEMFPQSLYATGWLAPRGWELISQNWVYLLHKTDNIVYDWMFAHEALQEIDARLEAKGQRRI